MLKKRFGLFLILVIGLASLLAACGDTATPPPASSPTTASTTSAATTSPATTAPVTTTAATTTAVSTSAATSTPASAATTPVPAAYSGPLTKVSLALDWTPNTNHTGIYVAQAKGWYKQQGIDLQILPYSDSAAPETLVGTGKADFGISAEEGTVFAVATGQPIVSIAAIIQHDTSALVTLKDSGLTRPKDLQGKKYAGFGAPYEEPVIGTMIKNDGGSTGQFQNITVNTDGLEAVEAHKADFVWIFLGWEAIQAKHQNVDLNVMPITKFGIPDRYTPTLITNQDMIKNKADVVKRFMAATAQGYSYAIANPKDAADILVAANSDALTDKVFVEDSQAYLSSKYAEGASYWGQQSLKVWTDYTKFMYQKGVLTDANSKPLTKEPDYQALFTNEFLPK